jgi:hypothetical protein
MYYHDKVGIRLLADALNSKVSLAHYIGIHVAKHSGPSLTRTRPLDE